MGSIEIKDLTLYGRMIYGINCLVNYWNTFYKEDCKDEMKSLLKKFCAYTNTEYLDDWQDDILPFIPTCIFEAVDESGKSLCRPERCSKYISRNESCILAKGCTFVKNTKRNTDEQKLYELYKKLDDDFLTILDMLYEIGASELYGKPSDMNESEQYLVDIINILKNHNVIIPLISDFKKYILNNPKRDMDFFGSKVDCTSLLDLL